MPCGLVLLSIAIFYIAEYLPMSSAKLKTLLGICFVDGFLPSILLTALYSYAFKFGHLKITYVNTGNALIAVAVTSLSFLIDLVVDKSDLSIKALIYLVFQITILTVLMILFGR